MGAPHFRNFPQKSFYYFLTAASFSKFSFLLRSTPIFSFYSFLPFSKFSTCREVVSVAKCYCYEVVSVAKRFFTVGRREDLVTHCCAWSDRFIYVLGYPRWQPTPRGYDTRHLLFCQYSFFLDFSFCCDIVVSHILFYDYD